ncbi:MAG: hypothetical protein ACKOQ4_13890 [Mycobacterium sp.]
MTAISDFVASKRRTEVLALTVAYYEVGQGDPIVFPHGNPTSSIVSHDVIPHVAHLGRCITPDLIGEPGSMLITIRGIHVAQEDSADDIGTALARWIPHARGDSAGRPAAGISP